MSDDTGTYNLGVLGYLGIAFILCKFAGLTAIATWPWVWVLAPFWGPFVLFVPLLAVLALHESGRTVHSFTPDKPRKALPAKAKMPAPPHAPTCEKYNRLNARPWSATPRPKRSAMQRSMTGRNYHPFFPQFEDEPRYARTKPLKAARAAADDTCPWPDMRHL